MNLLKATIILSILLAQIVVCACDVSHTQISSNTSKKNDASESTLPVTSFDHVQMLSQCWWIIGDTANLWKTTNCGKSWELIYRVSRVSGKTLYIGGVSFKNETQGILINGNSVYSTTDGGKNWAKISDINFTSKNCYFVNARQGWSIGTAMNSNVNSTISVNQSDSIFATNDGGLTWVEQASNHLVERLENSNWTLNDIFFLDSQNGWVSGAGVILWTQNGGTQWHYGNVPNYDYRKVKFLNKHFGWAKEHENKIGLFTTTDGGKNWQRVNSIPGYGARSSYVEFLSPNHGLSACLKTYETLDGGYYWKAINLPDIKDVETIYLGKTNNNILVILGRKNNNLITIVSTDNGTSWNIANLVNN